jgi:tetratricopeptide (TPR) repeat protein
VRPLYTVGVYGVGALALAACHAGAPEPPAPARPITVPALFDLSRVPDRPQLRVLGHSSTPAPRDSALRATGLGTVIDSAYDTAIENPIALDTNDARMYYMAGLAARFSDPTAASAALYWASRLDPSWAQPYFARWYVLRLAAQAATMSLGTGVTITKPVPLPDSILTRIDSLAVMAYSRDPFFDDALAMGDLSKRIHVQVSTVNIGRRAAVSRANDARIRQGAPMLASPKDIAVPHEWYIAYGSGDFAGAASQLAVSIQKHPDAITLYVYRARAQFFLAQYDSAVATMQAAVARIQTVESAKTLPVYFSKEAFTYAIGVAEQRHGRDSAARAAYQRTVTENLGFYMGHLHLANAALAVDDTATAITEATIAAEIRGDDPVVQFFLGYTLLHAGQNAEAVTHLDAAVRDDSAYALPYLYLAQARMTAHDTTAALGALRAFLVRARRDDDHRETVVAEIAALGGALTVGPASPRH